RPRRSLSHDARLHPDAAARVATNLSARVRFSPMGVRALVYARPVAAASIVVVSYNVWPDLERCLAALDETSHEVVAVDSAPPDGTQDRVRQRFPEVRLIELEEN